jgi:heat shock protein HslJ
VPALLGLILYACVASAGGSLENRYWRLTELDGRPSAGAGGDREPHLRFAEDSARVTGSTGCNRLTGPFTRDGATLRFGAVATTRMACVDSLLNQREQAFLAALGRTERYEVAGDTLTLIGSAGPLARLVAVTR